MKERKLRGLSATLTSILLAACAPSAPAPTPRETQTPQPTPTSRATEVLGSNIGEFLTFPIHPSEGYFTGGPHSDGLSNGVRYALDFAPKERVPCPGGVSDVVAEASAAGKVIRVGNESDPSDPYHSIVEVENDNGFILGYMHLSNLLVDVGDEIGPLHPLGNVSCEIPPGGETTGAHVHEYLKDASGNPLPIAGTIFEGFTVRELPRNYDGLLINGADVRTADKRRCGPNQASINACGGIRNDLNYSPFATETPAPTTSIAEILQEPQIDNPLLGAKQKVLQLWASTWNQDYSFSFNQDDVSDTDHDNFDTTIYINSNAVNFNEWYSAEKDSLLNSAETTTPLQITLDYTLEEFRDNKATASRFIVEMEFNNIKLNSIDYNMVSEADRANGITWAGQGNLHFIWRYRAINYYVKDDYYISNWGDRDKIENWIEETPDDQLPDFGQWRPGGVNGNGYGIALKAVNGSWQLLDLINQRKESPWTRVIDRYSPQFTYALPIDGNLNDICTYTNVDPCEKIEINFSN